MKKKKLAGYIVIILLFTCTVNIFGDGLNELAEKAATNISVFFKDKYNINTSIIGFENYSGISDLAAQQFYQLVVAGLEAAGPIDSATPEAAKFQYTDLMVNFNKGKGEFNLNRIHQLNYLIYLKLIRNKLGIGLGVSIFSRVTDRLVYVKYIETPFVREEMEFFDTVLYSFKEAGFAKIVELEAKPNLLDLKSYVDSAGNLRFLFLYADKLDMFQMQESRLQKYFSLPLNWSESYYPVLEPEGRLAVFQVEGRLLVTVGCNFSAVSKVLTLKENEWMEIGSVNVVPLCAMRLNERDYIAGVRYALGKNYFMDRLVLAPMEDFLGGRVSEEKSNYAFLEKMIPACYALNFSVGAAPGNLESIHLIDRDYKYRLLSDNCEPLTVEANGERGAALAVLDGQWVAMSQYSHENDSLYFYKIEKGSRRLMYQNDIDGEIVFISPGMWQSVSGFWVYVKRASAAPTTPPTRDYKLQFWSKKSE